MGFILFIMLYPLRSYVRDRWIMVSGLASVFGQLFIWGYTVSKIHPTADQLFLHYNILLGIDLIGEWWKVYFIPLFGSIIFFINFGLSYFFYKHSRFISRFLGVLTAFYEILILLSSLLIIGLNI